MAKKASGQKVVHTAAVTVMAEARLIEAKASERMVTVMENALKAFGQMYQDMIARQKVSDERQAKYEAQREEREKREAERSAQRDKDNAAYEKQRLEYAENEDRRKRERHESDMETLSQSRQQEQKEHEARMKQLDARIQA